MTILRSIWMNACFLMLYCPLSAQTFDSASITFHHSRSILKQPVELEKDSIPTNCQSKPFSILFPSLLFAYGAATKLSPGLRAVDEKIQRQWSATDPQKQVKLDDYLQYTPGISLYALWASGMQPFHSFQDMTSIFLLTNVINAGVVHSIKSITHLPRPDSTTFNTFPSGHTSASFAMATVLFHEYRHISPWIGIAGFAAATATGYLRIYNNQHWFSDILAGAGVGILSAKAAYAIYPAIRRKIFPRQKPGTWIMPNYQTKHFSVQFVKTL